MLFSCTHTPISFIDLTCVHICHIHVDQLLSCWVKLDHSIFLFLAVKEIKSHASCKL